MNLTWLDSNSWLMEIGGKRILLDPWLVGDLVFSNLDWLFKGKKTTQHPIPENIDLILLSQGLEDHAHPPTLKQLDRAIPVVASPNAAKVVEGLGYTDITPLAHGETFTLDDRVAIHAVPGSPIGPQLVENGYILQELETGYQIYYEPHGYHSRAIEEFAPVDVVITPLISLKLPLLGAVIQGQRNALKACQWLQPQVILPTAAGGEVDFQGLLLSVLREEGTLEDFRRLLAQNNLSTQVIEAQPGKTVQLSLQKRTSPELLKS